MDRRSSDASVIVQTNGTQPGVEKSPEYACLMYSTSKKQSYYRPLQI